MSNNFWFSADVDTGDVVAKTEIQTDGTVNRYEYTQPDNIKEGHGDTVYNSYRDFENDNPNREVSRDKDADESIYRYWAGNGFDMGLNDINSLNIVENMNSNVYSSFDILNHSAKKLTLRK